MSVFIGWWTYFSTHFLVCSVVPSLLAMANSIEVDIIGLFKRWLEGPVSRRFRPGGDLHTALLEMLQEILGEITPQSLRTFIHSRNPSAYELEQVLQFFGDLILSKVRSGMSTRLAQFFPLSQIPTFKILKSCIDQVVLQIFLEKLFVHFLASAIVVFFLFEYLMGYIERGGWATYSDTSWEFQATYVSIELRLAAYFWFKFRARAGRGSPSVSPPNKKNKFEPRLKASLRPGEKVRDVWLGEYDTFQEAAKAFWIGAFYYERWDRFTDEVHAWCASVNLPPLQAGLSDAQKASWVRGQAEDVARMRNRDQGAVAEEPHPGVAVEQYLVSGSGIPVTSGTAEAGSLLPVDDILSSSPPPCGDIEFMLQTVMSSGPHHSNFTGILGLEQRNSEDISVDDYEVSILPEVGGMSRGETGEHPELRTFANHTQVMDLPIAAQELQELKFTKRMRSTYQELYEQDWDFEMQPLDSIETFSVAFSKSDGQKRPKLTGTNYRAFEEIHEQGYKIILKPLDNASSQDATGRPQSGSISQDLCIACNARRSEE